LDVIPFEFDPPKLTPEQFEREVRRFLVSLGGELTNFEALHDQVITTSDGDYQIDVYVTFEVLGVRMKVLVECKHQQRPVEREVVQLLNGKLESVGAQKGIIFSTAGFQSGAFKYAARHGIALVHVADGKAVYGQKSTGVVIHYPPWVKPYVAIHTWCKEQEKSASYCYSQLPTFQDVFADANVSQSANG